MNFINRCNGCKLGTSYCVYTKTIAITNDYGKVRHEVPANNCIAKNEDDYAIFPDTTEFDNGTGSYLLAFRECEFRNPDSVEIFNSNLYLWESTSTNITTGDTFEVEGRRFDYDHPLYHIIDYNAPINTSGIVSLNERCNVMGKDNIYLVSRGWAIDDGGEEAKKAIGIPKIRNCDKFIYGTLDEKTGLIMHKSMKDWTTKIPGFNNFTNKKVNSYQVSKYNIFVDKFEVIDEFVTTVTSNPTIKARLFEAFNMILKGHYINLYQLLLNNGLDKNQVMAITNNVSTKNPKEVYKNAEGFRYNIGKIERLYFDIVKDKIKIGLRKDYILANIVNYILNDEELLTHNIGETKRHDKYVAWYESVVHTLDEVTADELHPNRFKINEYNSDNKLKSAINIVVDAIYKRNLLKVANLPDTFKGLFQRYKDYIKNYVEQKDILDMGAATLNVKEFLKASDDDCYNSFKKMLVHIEKITPIELRDLWNMYHTCFINNNAEVFWNYAEEMALELSFPHQIIMTLYTGEDEFDILDVEPRHEPYIRVKQKRYYNKQNQDREHQKMLDPMGEYLEYDVFGFEDEDDIFEDDGTNDIIDEEGDE